MADDLRREALIRLRGQPPPRKHHEVDMNTCEPAPEQATAINVRAKTQTQGMHRLSRQTNASRPAPIVLQRSAIRTDVQVMPRHQKEGLYHPQQYDDRNRKQPPPELDPNTKENGNLAVDSYEIQRERQRIMQQRYAELQEVNGKIVQRDAFLSSMTHQMDEEYISDKDNNSDDENNQKEHYPIYHDSSSNSLRMPLVESNQLLDTFDEKFWSNFDDQEHGQAGGNAMNVAADTGNQQEHDRYTHSSQPVSSEHSTSNDPSQATISDHSDQQSTPNHRPKYIKTTTQLAPWSSVDHTGIFSTRSAIFILVCVIVGITGFFFEEVLEVGNRLIETTPLILSRREHQELTRRLDLLQQEFIEFRATGDHVESQSQRLVHEVQAHLERIKNERERHQQMILQDMQDMRTYIKRLTEELIEQEKLVIQKRLMETITASLPHIEEIPEKELDSSLTMQTTTSEPVISNEEASSERHESFVSWQVLVMLLALSVLAGFVGLSVRKINHRNKSFQSRRRTRQWQQAIATINEDDIEVDDAIKRSDVFSSGGSGVETVSYMADHGNVTQEGNVNNETDRVIHDTASPTLDHTSSDQEEKSMEFPDTTAQSASRPRTRRSPRFDHAQRSPLSSMR